MIAFGYFLTLYKNTVNTYNISIHQFSNSHITDTSRKLDTTQS